MQTQFIGIISRAWTNLTVALNGETGDFMLTNPGPDDLIMRKADTTDEASAWNDTNGQIVSANERWYFTIGNELVYARKALEAGVIVVDKV